MSNLIQNQEDQHVLHKLNYHKIRDGLFNVTKWHDDGFSTYLFKSNDVKENNKVVGKQLDLHINGVLKYTVTYIYNKNPQAPTILINKQNVRYFVSCRKNHQVGFTINWSGANRIMINYVESI